MTTHKVTPLSEKDIIHRAYQIGGKSWGEHSVVDKDRLSSVLSAVVERLKEDEEVIPDMEDYQEGFNGAMKEAKRILSYYFSSVFPSIFAGEKEVK